MQPSSPDLEASSPRTSSSPRRLKEAEDTLAAIRGGDVDALIVGDDIYTLDSANTASNKLRKDVLAQMEDAVLAFDNDEHVIFMNAAAARQYGKEPSDTLGRSKSELYEEIWPAANGNTPVWPAMPDFTAYQVHSIHKKRDGTSIHVESTISQLRDVAGNAIGHLSVIRDITDRIRAEEAIAAANLALVRRERQFSTLVENSPDIFARFDRELRHLYVSPVAERYTGIAPSAHIGAPTESWGCRLRSRRRGMLR